MLRGGSGWMLLTAPSPSMWGCSPAGSRRPASVQLRRARRRSRPKPHIIPFQWPAVPFRGSCVVVYMDRQVRPIGGPRFTIPVAEADPRTCYSLGDRTHKPRPKLLLTDLR